MSHEELKELKVGDVVRLNSGGGKMTVDHIEDNLISCVCWHDSEFSVAKCAQNLDYALLKVENSA